MSQTKSIKPLLGPNSRPLVPSTPTSSITNTNQTIIGEKPKRKRQRLDHLSQEEKVMRRKLKNRMAAQSARDRKKVKMMDLEIVNNGLKAKNDSLIKRNDFLEKRVKTLEKENESLRKSLMSYSVSNKNVEQLLPPMMLKDDLLDIIKMEDINTNEGVIFDVNMNDGTYLNDLVTSKVESCSGRNSPLSSVGSELSDDSGCLLSHQEDSGSFSSACSTSDESFESAEFINEPQQKDQDLSVVRHPSENQLRSAHQWRQQQSNHVKQTTTTTNQTNWFNEIPLNLTMQRQSRTRWATNKQMISSTQRLMNFLFALVTHLTNTNLPNQSVKQSLETTIHNWPVESLSTVSHRQMSRLLSNVCKQYKRVRRRPLQSIHQTITTTSELNRNEI